MSSVAEQMTVPTKVHSLSAIRIVSLPRELQTTYQVFDFVREILDCFAESVNIVSMKSENGGRYRSAFVDIDVSKSTPTMLDVIAKDCLVIQSDSIAYLPGGIHFDNGKPMDHLKVVATKRHSPSTETMELDASEWTSIYIPVIPPDLSADNGDVRYVDQDGLADLFEDHLKIGKISHIDLITRPIPGTNRNGTGAYVHFTNWYDNEKAKNVRSIIEAKGDFVCTGFYDGFEFRNFDHRRFISLKMNKTIDTVPHSTLEVEKKLAEMEKLYERACASVASLTRSMMVREKKLEHLEEENARLRLSTTVKIPGMDVKIDVGNIVAENHRLKEALDKKVNN